MTYRKSDHKVWRAKQEVTNHRGGTSMLAECPSGQFQVFSLKTWEVMPQIEASDWEVPAKASRAKIARHQDVLAFGVEVGVRFGGELNVARVVRATATLFVTEGLGGPQQFKRDTGTEKGGRSHYGCYQIVAEDLVRVEALTGGKKTVDFVKSNKRLTGK